MSINGNKNVEMIPYTDPVEFIKRDIFKGCKSLHVCATKSLMKAVKKAANEDKKHYKGPEETVISATWLINHLLGEWATTKKRLFQYARLTEVIREARSNANEEEKQILRAFRLNQADVLKTIRILSEVSESPATLAQKVNEPEEVWMVRLWRELEKKDESFKNIRSKITEWKSNVNKFKKNLFNVLDDCTKGKWDKETILLHGFYFITPIQHEIFTLLKQAGFKLIFMNLYDPRYPEVFRSVKEFISSEYGWVDYEEWHPVIERSSLYTFGDVFALSFASEGNVEQFKKYRKNVQNVLHKKRYESFYEFLDEYEKGPELDNKREKKKDIIYLSPSDGDLNNRLKEYHPDVYQKDRHFLSYPFGQFLLHLHQMWNEQTETLVMNDRALMECFSSGWLFDKETNENARDYTSILSDLLPFFQGCQTIEEWEETAQLLWEIRNKAVRPYEKHENKGSASDRFHRMLENPFVRFSYFNISIEDIEQVIRFIKQLFSIARFLFKENGDTVSLHEHFKRLEEILNDGIRDTLTQEEKALMDKLRKILIENNEEDQEFLVQDLADAISVYLSGGLSFEDDEPSFQDDALSDNSLCEDNEEDPNRIFSFQEIDGKVIEAAIDHKIIHVCGLDENSLPLSESALPWPLTRKTLESMKTNTSLYMLLLRENLKSEISRYLFYSFASFTGKGIVSWMRNWNGNEGMEESFYLMLLELKEEPYNYEPSIKDVKPPALDPKPFEEAKKHFDHYPIEAMNEMAFCPRRFFYSFLTREFASYRKDFHLEFLFGTLVKMLAAMTDASREEIEEQVFALFPQWTDLRRKILMEENYKTQYIRNVQNANRYRSSSYEGISYPFVQKQFQFLLHSGMYQNEESISKKWDLVFGSGDEVKNAFWKTLSEEHPPMLTATPSKLCRFCPYMDECPESYYPIDDDLREME
jgi:hypothetical protein